MIGRRGFIKAGAGGLGAIAAMPPAAAESAETLQPWWDARPASAKANRPVAIDLHAHWVPPPYAKAMADLGKPLGNPFPLELDIAARKKWMDEHGVQMHVLTLNGGMPWQIVTPEEGVRLAQIVNDAGVEAHAAFPDRYVSSIELPSQRWRRTKKRLLPRCFTKTKLIQRRRNLRRMRTASSGCQMKGSRTPLPCSPIPAGFSRKSALA